MVDLTLLLSTLYQGLTQKDPNFYVALDSSYKICDNKRELEYHLHKEKPYEIYHKGHLIITGEYLTPAEAKILDNVCALIPEVKRAYLYDIYTSDYIDTVKGEDMGTNGGYSIPGKQ